MPVRLKETTELVIQLRINEFKNRFQPKLPLMEGERVTCLQIPIVLWTGGRVTLVKDSSFIQLMNLET
jgi:hypothetical protein